MIHAIDFLQDYNSETTEESIVYFVTQKEVLMTDEQMMIECMKEMKSQMYSIF